MASRINSDSNTGRDLISELPADLKDRILEYLPTRYAARTALLSTHWNDVWLRHGRLVFDSDFFKCVYKSKGDFQLVAVDIIIRILFSRAGPVKKFTIINSLGFKLEQSDLDEWCNFLSKNGVEELGLMLLIFGDFRYKLPDCILYSPTIRKLTLQCFCFGCPFNARVIFPSVISLELCGVDFEPSVNGIVSSIPSLEELSISGGNGMNNFEISAPKLKSLSVIAHMNEAEWRWFMRHWDAVKTLCFCPDPLWGTSALLGTPTMLPSAIKLKVLKLDGLYFTCVEHLTFVIQLLQNSPKLRELNILLMSIHGKEDASRLLADLDGNFIKQDLKMLNTLKIDMFSGSRLEMLFVKELLLKSPSLEKVFIQAAKFTDLSLPFKIRRELLSFPRASQKAQLVFNEVLD